MSGQPTPSRIVEAFAVSAGASYITSPFPAASQIGVTPGAASLADGFPPLCFLDPADGGVLPSGADFNGILNLISSWAAYLAAGQQPRFDSTLATAMGGYAVGARVQSGVNPKQIFTNTLNGNTNDPDSVITGWISSVALYSTSIIITAGTHNDVVLPGPSDYVIAVNTAAGAITYTGAVAQRDGQRVTYINTNTGLLTFAALTGSSAANQNQAPSDVSVVQNQSITWQYSTGLGKWVIA